LILCEYNIVARKKYNTKKIVSETVLIPRRIQPYVTNIRQPHAKRPLFLSDFNET